MKGKAHSEPTPHVVWQNGTVTQFADWPTARECAIAEEMLDVLKECRAVLFVGGNHKDINEVLGDVIKIVNIGDGFEEPLDNVLDRGGVTFAQFPIPPTSRTATETIEAEKQVMEIIKSFPKPPGFA